MKKFIEQIKKAYTNDMYYLALNSSLILPDICGALESDNGIAHKDKYIKWFNTYIAPKYNDFLNGEDCYYFRSSIIHQHSTYNKRNKYSKIIFIEPTNNNIIFHNNIINDALNIDIKIFCEDMCQGVEKWFKLKSNNENVKKNMKNSIQRYPNGLSPYITGIPVIC